jgi:hypothetical protein
MKKADKRKYLSALMLCSEAEGARTLNLRIDNPQQQIDKSQDNKDLETHDSGDYKSAYKENTKTKQKVRRCNQTDLQIFSYRVSRQKSPVIRPLMKSQSLKNKVKQPDEVTAACPEQA